MENSERLVETGLFVRRTAITFASRALNLVLGVATSVAIARLLGPEGKGIYTLAALLPALVVTFADLGVGPATVYYVAQGRYHRREVLGNNVLLGISIGTGGMAIGLVAVFLLRQSVFSGVAQGYLLFALALIPVDFLFSYIQHILLGAQRIKEYNLITIVHAVLFLAFILIALGGLKAGVAGALAASLSSWVLADALLLIWARKITGGISFKPNTPYLKNALTYGIQAHLGNILGFLNYRIDMFFVNYFLNPAAVGFYSIGVGLVEKLWLVSQAASTILFPKVAAEKDDPKRREFTPLVARTVLWVTALGALAILLISRWIVELLYSSDFLPAVRPLQILLPGIVALSAARVLANDIAGRGRVMLNNCAMSVTVATNVILNLLWIPRYGIEGAALASTVSYGVTLVVMIFIYCRLSGNYPAKVLLPQRSDLALYRRTGAVLSQWVRGRVKGVLSS
ncbi:MAG: flippase [bacterium]